MNLKLSVSPEEKMSNDVHSMFLLFRPKVLNAIKKIRETKRRLNNDSILFFSVWVFSHKHSRITGLQEKGEDISLTPHYHFHPLHRHLDISRVITAESSLYT